MENQGREENIILKGEVTFEGVCFEGVFGVEGVSVELLRLAVEHRWLHFEWILL